MLSTVGAAVRDVSLPEAAAILGLTREGVRRRLLRGRLDGRKSNETGEWIVTLPDDAGLAPVGNGEQSSVTVADRGQELEASRQLELELARAEERLVAAEALMGERDRTIGELRREVAGLANARERAAVAEAVNTELRAELARLRLPWWRRLMG